LAAEEAEQKVLKKRKKKEKINKIIDTKRGVGKYPTLRFM